MTQSIFDSSAFLKSLADDRELAEELLSAFLEDSPIRQESLGQALDDDDADAASKLAHSLKGMCGVIRAEALVTLALNMEHAAKEGDLAGTRETYARFTGVLAAAHDEIKQFMSRG